jgi:hypothetical protein
VLIGEVVMRSPNRTQAVRQLCAVHA